MTLNSSKDYAGKPKWHDEWLSFTEYLNKNPKQRFWQALKNWSCYAAIISYDSLPISDLTDDLVAMASVCGGVIRDTYED